MSKSIYETNWHKLKGKKLQDFKKEVIKARVALGSYWWDNAYRFEGLMSVDEEQQLLKEVMTNEAS